VPPPRSARPDVTALPDDGLLAPPFPLPARGDKVLVLVSPGLITAAAAEWCRVVSVDTGPGDLFPVAVRYPDGRRGAYQQHEIRGWQPAVRRVAWARLTAWLRR
jgi:hypothetical protein